MDTTELEAGYRSLLDTARGGGFAAPLDEASWPADLLLAHVVANDRLLSATTAQVLAGERAAYDNAAARHRPYLQAITRGAGDWDGLVAQARVCGLELVLLVRELDEQQASAPVSTRISDDEGVRLEAPMPWSGVLKSHAQLRLPEWADALAALRSP